MHNEAKENFRKNQLSKVVDSDKFSRNSQNQTPEIIRNLEKCYGILAFLYKSLLLAKLLALYTKNAILE